MGAARGGWQACRAMFACGAGGLCFAKPFLWPATTARTGQAGNLFSLTPRDAGSGLRPPRGCSEIARKAPPPTRWPCRGLLGLKTEARSRRRSGHTFTARKSIALGTPVARLLALRGATFASIDDSFRRGTSNQSLGTASHELPRQHTATRRRSTVNPWIHRRSATGLGTNEWEFVRSSAQRLV